MTTISTSSSTIPSSASSSLSFVAAEKSFIIVRIGRKQTTMLLLLLQLHLLHLNTHRFLNFLFLSSLSLLTKQLSFRIQFDG